jgi:hypothetical protein
MHHKTTSHLELDFGGAEILEHAQKAYECLGELLNSCGLEESKKKSVEPTNRMT